MWFSHIAAQLVLNQKTLRTTDFLSPLVFFVFLLSIYSLVLDLEN